MFCAPIKCLQYFKNINGGGGGGGVVLTNQWQNAILTGAKIFHQMKLKV